MKILLFILMLSGCGKDYELQTIEHISEIVVEREVVVPQEFEGYWYCENGSNVELLADFKNLISFETLGQYLISDNKDGSFGLHPKISLKDLIIHCLAKN